MAAPCARCCRSAAQVQRFVRLPAREVRRRPLRAAGGPAPAVPRPPVPRLHPRRDRPVPRDPRQRRGSRGRGRGPGALLRDRAEAPPPRPGDPADGDRRARPPTCCDFVAEELRRSAERGVRWSMACSAWPTCSAADRGRPAGPAVHALSPRAFPSASTISTATASPRSGQGHRRPPPLRELRRGGAVPAPGGARPQRGRDQADAVPHHAATARSSRR